MDDVSDVCAPLPAEPDTQSNTISAPIAASVIDTDKVINTKTVNSEVEGDKIAEELLKTLLTDDYCHVCEAVLQFKSQRLSHYEGKKHAQKLKVYLQAKRAERINRESTAPQQTMTADKDRLCELCNMVFSSHLVAKSHYEGKVHAKNLRKQNLQPPVRNRYTDVCTLPRLTHPDSTDQNSGSDRSTERPADVAAATTNSSAEVDLKDPNKYCALCTASFNNPQMALQHYNGRKHQRNQARQELIKELGDCVQQGDAASSLVCQMCSLQFNSVEMYQAHLQGNKHQIREKKVVELCKSQQKVYSTFADELADYIQVQKARGITPKTSEVPPQGDALEDEEVEQGLLNEQHTEEMNNAMYNFTPNSNPPHQSHPGHYYPAGGWHPPHQVPAWPPHGWDNACPPPPVFPGSGFLQDSTWLRKTRRRRKQSSSSSYTTSSSDSSYSSSYGSSTSDSDDSEHKRREGRRTRRSKKEIGKRTREEDSDKEERRRKQQRKEPDDGANRTRKQEESAESEPEQRRKKQKKHGKWRQKDKKSRGKVFEEEGGQMVMDSLKPGDALDKRKSTKVHIQTDIDVKEREEVQDEMAKTKNRKDRRKVKEKVDSRTEEEKLWDDSILGC